MLANMLDFSLVVLTFYSIISLMSIIRAYLK